MNIDEIALLNDISAATAGAISPPSSDIDHTGKQSVEERLAKLSELKAKGFISEEEYAAKRKQVLDAI